jgi:four helix bundle protein
MRQIRSLKDLTVWQRAMDLVEECYKTIGYLPPKEKYSLSNQIVRAAVSIPSNLAEGYRRNGRAEYIHFCGIASGSAAELETQLLIVQRVYKDVPVDCALPLVVEVQKMLYALIKQLRPKP